MLEYVTRRILLYQGICQYHNNAKWKIVRKLFVFIFFSQCILIVNCSAEVYWPPSIDQIFRTLTPEHPRLILDKSTIRHIKTLISDDSMAAGIYREMKYQANQDFQSSPSEYELPDGKRLLKASRRVVERVRKWAFLFLIEGDQRYVDRVWRELETAAQFKNWNPTHFLDTAEMTYAFATGYDWLYDQWSEKQRRILLEAIIEKGLKPGIDAYKKGRKWVYRHNNWNQVCNSGLGLGALAIADDEPELASQILYNSFKSLSSAMSYYEPDGGGAEGVTYWAYGARYNILFLSGLHTAIGTDFGLSKIPGFKESGDYQLYLSGAKRKAFNFSDSGTARMSSPMHFWMSRVYDMPHYGWFRYEVLRKYGQGNILDLIWYDDSAKEYDPSKLDLDKWFRKVDIASLRSSWTDVNAVVLGIQAGGNMNLKMHRHVDQGSFIFEAHGERWVIDLGMEKETYQRHRNKRNRWDFYRIRAEGHNTLVFNPSKGPAQDLQAECPIVKFESSPVKAKAVVDLSNVYAEYSNRVVRTFVTDRKTVTVSDDISTKATSELYWFLHTMANVVISKNGKTAILSQNGKRLFVKLQLPIEAVFTVMSAKPFLTSPNPKQNNNNGRRKLTIHLKNVNDINIKVQLIPDSASVVRRK